MHMHMSERQSGIVLVDRGVVREVSEDIECE